MGGILILKLFKKNRSSFSGFTLVEVMTSVLIFSIVMFGAIMFFISGKTNVRKASAKEIGLQLAAGKLEELRGTPFVGINDSTESVIIGSNQYSTYIDVTDMTEYKVVQLSVTWNTGVLSLSTVIADK